MQRAVELLVRFEGPAGPAWGRLEGASVHPLMGGEPAHLPGALPPAGADSLDPLPVGDVRLLAPVHPRKVVCVGLNYRTHAREFGQPLPEVPLLFMKPPSAVSGPGDAICLPPQSHRVDFEGELVAVLGRRLKNATPQEAAGALFAFTCGNDVTARDLQTRDGQWTRAKSFDTFCPLGPALARGLEPGNLRLRTELNGAERQRDSTANLIFSVAELVSFISTVMTLEPGDCVFTGTPAGVGALAPGDEIAVEIGGIGRLENRVEAAA